MILKFDKLPLIVFIVGAVLGLLCGFFSGKAIYDRPITESVKRDTITIHDTIPDIAPIPKDSVRTRWVTRWLPAKHDTITQWKTLTKYDSIAVQVPITSKHYGNDTYDAWVSGYEPSLDSIKVYKETQYITETITKIKTPNKVGVDVIGGIDYNIEQKEYIPFALGEFSYKPNRFEFGIRGGVEKRKKLEVKVGGFVKVRVF